MEFAPFLQHFEDSALAAWLPRIDAQIEAGLNPARYGDLPRWLNQLRALPDLTATAIELNTDAVTLRGESSPDHRQQLETALRGLHPWRKGPFKLFDVFIDTEWRSDWKWRRLAPHIQPLAGRTVLDVGCGSGYHCWRMRGEQAQLVVGIEPSPLFVVQFQALQRYIQDHRVGVLPVGVEQLPARLGCFDTVFSMGILYHRRSPFDHLLQLREALRSGGELVLETLVIEGNEGATLVPSGRYAKMGNVWFIPSCLTLELWLKKLGFRHVRTVDVSVTESAEQRHTDWMRFHSLANFLDPDDPCKTVEGYPAPTRAIILAEAP